MKSDWTAVCSLNDIAPDTGICALVQGQQVAIFRQRSNNKLYAVGNFDPVGQANVMSRGLLAHLGGKMTVAAPLYKQHYCLETGRCLEDESLALPVYQVREQNGHVEISLV
ncbi:nitrite reductase small subunit NirD [Pokkaliibacter sp. CJK22405]|uniref:nitrite reductase small subunit NirD n=1 Tax=Pokkaliibacter sp. CJK22405 TaxID=3384615 RepID=UPI0039851FF3